MRVVINTCYGGFSLSPAAVRRLAEMAGRECYFFKGGLGRSYQPLSEEEAGGVFSWSAFDVPNPDEVLGLKRWPDMSDDERAAQNAAYEAHALTSRDYTRDDPRLLIVIDELGAEKASGSCAALKIVEIPDGVKWEIEEYDGMEWVAEAHETWS